MAVAVILISSAFTEQPLRWAKVVKPERQGTTCDYSTFSHGCGYVGTRRKSRTLKSVVSIPSMEGMFAPPRLYCQTATTATSRPEALTSRFMSSGSLVRFIVFRRRAIVTTAASTTSVVLLLSSSRPASCASLSPRGTTTHPAKKRRSWACCGDRLTWATTGAGTEGTTPSSKRALCSAHARLSFLSAATRTAAS